MNQYSAFSIRSRLFFSKNTDKSVRLEALVFGVHVLSKS